MEAPFKTIQLATGRDAVGFGCLLAGTGAFALLYPDPTLLSLVTIGLVWLSVNMAWNLVLGFAGIFSFGQIAFFSVGAYSAGIANFHLGLPPAVSTLAGPLGGAVAAFLIGLAALRLRGVYVALVTLAFHELLRTMISTDYSALTGGPNGLTVSRYLAGASPVAQAQLDFAVAWAIVGLSGGLIWWMLRSPFGLALVSCRDAEHVATARGISRKHYQIAAFVVSGALAGLAGGFYAHYVGVVAPTIISFALVMNLFAMIVVGGIGTFWGPVLGTAAITALSTYLQGVSPQYQTLIIAFALVAITLFLPAGLVGLVRRRKIGALEQA